MNLFRKKHATNAYHEHKFVSHIGNDPYVDWGLIVIVSGICGIVALVGAVFLFLDIQKGPMIDADTSFAIPQPAVNPADLSKIVDTFSKKSITNETTIRTPYTVSTDPSLQ